MTLWFFLKGDKAILRREPLVIYCTAFVLLMILSCTFAVQDGVFYLTRNMFLIVFGGVAPLVSLVTTWDRTLRLFKYWVAINLYVAVWAILHHGRGTGDFLLDENDLALAMAMAFPYGLYLRSLSSATPAWRLVYNLAPWACVLAVVISFSRGGFVGLIGVSAAVWILSKRKLRIALVTAAVVGTGVSAGSLVTKLLPNGYIARVQSATNPDQSTRVERLQSWQVGWIMWKHNPIFGTGAGQFPWNVDKYEPLASFWVNRAKSRDYQGRQVHSLYFALLSEMGLAGAAVFLLLVGTIVTTLARIIAREKRYAARAPPAEGVVDAVRIQDQALLAKAMLCSLAGFLSSGTFISVLYYPHIWLLAGFAAALKNTSCMADGGESPPQSRAKPRRRFARSHRRVRLRIKGSARPSASARRRLPQDSQYPTS